MIELAAAHWDGLELPVVIRKLMSLGIEVPEERVLPINIEQYIAYHPGKRKRIWDFWQKSRTRLLVDDSKVLRALQHKLSIRLDLDRDRWLHGPGLFLGGNGKRDVEACFQPIVAQHVKGRLQNAGNERIFLGAGWLDVLLMPLCDLPNRIKGFLFLGREGRTPEDIAFKFIRYSSSYILDRRTGYSRGLETDCGLALYEALQFAEDAVVVMDNPLLALKLQCWHLQDHGTPAPLVSMFANKLVRTSPNLWGQIKQKPTFWGPPTAEMFRHAKAANAYVCMAGFTPTGPSKRLLRTPLQEWLQRIRNEAEPWQSALERLLNELPTAAAETLLLGMELQQSELQQFATKCPESLRLRLEPCCLTQATRTVIANGSPIREDHGWYNDQSGEQISNAILRIEQVIYHDKMDQTYYAGRILFKDQEVPFCVQADDVEKATFTWMRKKLLKAGAGFLEFSAKWEAQAVSLATKFHQPEVVKGFNRIGWDEERACFVFPTYLLTSRGEVQKEPTAMLFKGRTPAILLREPESVNTAELPSGDGSSVFWTVAASVASNILAPVFGMQPKGIGLVGAVAEPIGRISARTLGCAEHYVHSDCRTDIGQTLTGACSEHGWPPFFTPPKLAREGWTEWLANDEPKNCVAPLEWYTARALATRKGWHIIESGYYAAVTTISEEVRKIIPAFLQFVAAQRFKLPTGYARTDGTSFAHIVYVWLRQWLASIGGEAIVGRSDIANFDADSRRESRIGDALLDIVCRLFHDGELSLERAGFIPGGKAIKALICFPGKDGGLGKIFIPKAVINKLLDAHKAPALDTCAVSHALAETGMAEEHEYASLPGWLLSEDEWNKRLHRWRECHRFKLRVE